MGLLIWLSLYAIIGIANGVLYVFLCGIETERRGKVNLLYEDFVFGFYFHMICWPIAFFSNLLYILVNCFSVKMKGY